MPLTSLRSLYLYLYIFTYVCVFIYQACYITVYVCVCIGEYTFILSIQIYCILDHKASLKSFQKISVIKTVLTNQNAIKLEIIKTNNNTSHICGNFKTHFQITYRSKTKNLNGKCFKN